MKRCPTCRAAYTGKRHCHRCRTDLGPLLDIEQKAHDHRRQAALAFVSGNYEMMYLHAGRACSLQRTPEATILLACAALLTHRFETTLTLYHPPEGRT